ncbi:MAG: MFS transporter [Parcubacteria group bacterium]|nr:MFS transporter [Parcubacteria group bacterium]
MYILEKFFGNANKKEAISWAFYDFANSAYVLLILTFIFPVYFKEVIVGVEKGDFYWGLIVSGSILIGGLLAPVVGAIADHDTRRKIKLIIFACISMIGGALLFFTGSDTVLFVVLVFMVSNVTFEVAQTLYDSFLARVSTPETVGRISGFAWGLGYIGGVVALLLLKPLYENGYAGDFIFGYKLVFPLTALFFFVFSLPLFLFVKEEVHKRVHISRIVLIQNGFKSVGRTLRDIRKHKQIAWFLLGFYFMNDALVTIFSFIALYARETLFMGFEEILMLLLIIQVIAFPTATIFGFLSDKKGPKKILLFTIAIWIMITILLSLATTKAMFYVIAGLTALVIGSSQSVARSWFSRLVPNDKRFEFFGFNGFASKIAATLGPLLFGTISVMTGNQRIAMAALIPFFLIAFIIFWKMREPKQAATNIDMPL